MKYINRHVRKDICAGGPYLWLDLGIELLQSEYVAELQKIKNSISDSSLCCSEMFRLWLERQRTASWRNLIDALKQIDQNRLACNIEHLLTVEQTGEEASTVLDNNQQTFGQALLQGTHKGKFV